MKIVRDEKPSASMIYGCVRHQRPYMYQSLILQSSADVSFFIFKVYCHLQLASLANTRFVRHFPPFDKTKDVNYFEEKCARKF